MSQQDWNGYLNQIPHFMQAKALRYVRWQDRHAYLYGRLLLNEGLKKSGFTSDCMHKIQYNAYGKPFLNDQVDFSISHSGELVACAVSDQGAIGLDVEKIRTVDISDFKDVFDQKEWEAINAPPDIENRVDRFFDYWTRKESLIKADGRGLSVDLKTIVWCDERAHIEDNIWYTLDVKCFEGYCCHVASRKPLSDARIKRIEFNNKAG